MKKKELQNAYNKLKKKKNRMGCGLVAIVTGLTGAVVTTGVIGTLGYHLLKDQAGNIDTYLGKQPAIDYTITRNHGEDDFCHQRATYNAEGAALVAENGVDIKGCDGSMVILKVGEQLYKVEPNVLEEEKKLLVERLREQTGVSDKALVEANNPYH